MTEVANPLEIHQVCEAVFRTLAERFQGETVELPDGQASAEIADDSDYHRSRSGYMVYNEAVTFAVNNHHWLLILGTDTFGYPADRYACDVSLIALATPTLTGEEAALVIRHSTYFRHSLFFGYANGLLSINQQSAHAPIFLKAIGRIEPAEIIATHAEARDDLFHLDGRPVLKQPTTYRPEIVARLVDAAICVLETSQIQTQRT